MQPNLKMIPPALPEELLSCGLSCRLFNAALPLEKLVPQCSSQNQPKKSVSTNPNNSYLSLVLRIQRSGHFEVIRADLLPGRLIPRLIPTSDYIYEIYTREKELFVGFLAEDPFVQRSFSDINKGDPEERKATSTTTIIVTIPDINQAFINVHKLGLRLNRLKSPPSFDVLTSEVFKNLRKEDQLEAILDFPPARLGRAIQAKMNKRAQ